MAVTLPWMGIIIRDEVYKDKTLLNIVIKHEVCHVYQIEEHGYLGLLTEDYKVDNKFEEECYGEE